MNSAGMGDGLITSPPSAARSDLTELVILPPGPIHKAKKMMLARFLQATPALASEPGARWKLAPDKTPDPSTRRPASSSRAPPLPPWVLERGGELCQRGVPEGQAALSVAAAITNSMRSSSSSSTAAAGRGGRGPPAQQAPAGGLGGNYFIFVRKGNTITAHPVDMVYNFRPPPKRKTLSLEDAEARMREARAAESAVSLNLIPKSVKEAAKEMAGGEGKGALEATLAALFDEGGGDTGGDDLGIALPGRKGKGGSRGAEVEACSSVVAMEEGRGWTRRRWLRTYTRAWDRTRQSQSRQRTGSIRSTTLTMTWTKARKTACSVTQTTRGSARSLAWRGRLRRGWIQPPTRRS
ncbi:hypothetical protein V8C86DRAFT_360008 [Haematococcus lacustris]